MFTLIRGAAVYAPEFLGTKDILLGQGKILKIADSIRDTDNLLGMHVEIVDASGYILTPGFIDLHVHITGGGGEGGFSTRTPEIAASDLLDNGITTVVGVLGTDGVTRSLENLYAKAKALEASGLTTYIYTGSYQLPPVTFTGSVQKDLVLIDKVIGLGEIALSDHRAFHPGFDELARLAAQSRNGGLIAGKAGVVHLHMGDAPGGLDLLFDIIERTGIPARQFIPTHVNRNRALLAQACELEKKGGFIDLTAGFVNDKSWPECVPAYEAMKYLLEHGADEDMITMSSDGNGSIPAFDSEGRLIGIETASCRVLHEDFRKAVLDQKLPVEKVLKVVTVNPAHALGLGERKGAIAPGMDADLVLMESSLNIRRVYSAGMLRSDSEAAF